MNIYPGHDYITSYFNLRKWLIGFEYWPFGPKEFQFIVNIGPLIIMWEHRGSES